MTEEEYIKERVDDQIKWYGAKIAINKAYYIWTNGHIIFFAAMIPFVSGVDIESTRWPQYTTAILGVMTATLTGLSALLKFQEKWTTYRATAESLRREKLLYKTATSPYRSSSASFNLFVQNMERIMNEENTAWTQLINKQEEEPSPGGESSPIEL